MKARKLQSAKGARRTTTNNNNHAKQITTCNNKIQQWHIQLSTPLLGSKLEACALPPSYILERQTQPCITMCLLQDLQVRLQLCLPCTGRTGRPKWLHSMRSTLLVTGSHRCVQYYIHICIYDICTYIYTYICIRPCVHI